MREQAELACFISSSQVFLACSPREIVSQSLSPTEPLFTHLYNEVVGSKCVFSHSVGGMFSEMLSLAIMEVGGDLADGDPRLPFLTIAPLLSSVVAI